MIGSDRPISAARRDRGAGIRTAAIYLNFDTPARDSQADLIDNMLRIRMND